MRNIALVALLVLSACAGKPVKNIPTPPATKEVIVCNVEVKQPILNIDAAQPGQPLEQQNAILRSSLAQLQTYAIELEASFVQCGGKIKK